MNNVAHSYSSLGRHRDALEMFQNTLVFRRRILTVNNPQIGKCFGSMLTGHFDGICEARCCRDEHGQRCIDVQFSWDAS